MSNQNLPDVPNDVKTTRSKSRAQREQQRNEKEMNEGLNDKSVSHSCFDYTHDNVELRSCNSSPTKCATNGFEAKLKLARAQFLKRKLEEKLELEHRLQMFEAQKEIELAQLECALFDDDVLGDCIKEDEEIKVRAVKSETYAGTSYGCPSQPLDMHGLTTSLATILNHARLPQLEVCQFSGQTQNYLMFTKQFDNIIASKVADKGQLLSYLIHYCTGKAKTAIEACTTLPPDRGYDKAREILHELYGQEHMIARAHIDELVKNKRLVANTSEALTDLATTLRSSQLTLSELGYLSDLNSASNLEQIITRLPLELQSRWADLADSILVSGREPDFNDVTKFVETRARTARTRYGMLWRQNRREVENRKTDSNNRWSHVQTHSIVTNSTKQTCKLCDDSHPISMCPKFAAETIDQRKIIVKKHRLCYLCLKPGHGAEFCRAGIKCDIKGCNYKHNSLLHPEMTDNKVAHLAKSNLIREQVIDKVYFGTVPVRIIGPNGTVETYAFIDSGSDTSLISENIVGKLGLEGNTAVLNMTTVNGTSTRESMNVEVEVEALDGSGTVHIDSAYSVSRLPLKWANPFQDNAQNDWDHLKGIHFPELSCKEIGLLIGADTPDAFWSLEQRIGGRKQPFATRSHLGWMVLGPTSRSKSEHQVMWCECSEDVNTRECLQRFFEHEFLDLESHERGLSVEDHRALDIARNTVRMVNGHVELSPPWKQDQPCFPNNLEMAKKRLQCLSRRLSKDTVLHEKYRLKMEEHIKKGYIVKIRSTKPGDVPRLYIPHHPVFNPKKPSKTRIVFDCAARFNNTSLNDVILQGPNTVNSLVGILLRFRRYPIALGADIEEMFLQVKLPEKDQPAFSLLWWDDGNLNNIPDHYQLTVHPFGAVSSPFCAHYALKKVIEEFKPNSSMSMDNLVDECFYVDDCLTSVESVDEAIEFIRETSDILKRGGFRLTKWVSNNIEALKSVLVEERAPILRNLTFEEVLIERTLGLHWDMKRDSFVYEAKPYHKIPTKRVILSCVSSIYDPLGLLSPYMLPAKQLLRKLCIMKLGWDDPISGEELERWVNWTDTINRLNQVSFDRCLRGNHCKRKGRIQLHIFCDASESGYGSAAYVRYVDSEGEMSSSLVLAKAKVTPINVQTIPRLELTAATLAARMSSMIQAELRLEFEEIHYWCDSAIVLHYIKNTETRYQTFVANRLAMIHRLTKASQWRYIPSEVNVADWVSRGLDKLDSRFQTWSCGPQFLTTPQPSWPTWALPTELKLPCLEVKSTTLATVTRESSGMQRLITYYSDWWRLLKAIAWLSRFKSYLVIKYRARTDISLLVGLIKPQELDRATWDIVRFVQRSEFSKELSLLAVNSTRPRPTKISGGLRLLNPFISEGIILVGGRLQYSNLPRHSQHPAILPSKNHVTELIIRHLHSSEGHIGSSQLLAKVRERFWVLKGGAAIRRVVQSCTTCKKISPRLGNQIMAPLPGARVEPDKYPFMSVGTDFFGPFLVKRGRVTEKRYGCLFTCMKMRAIHIEIAHNLSADSFLMALMRFIARRGCPKELFSDNGSNLVGAHNELQRNITQWPVDRIHNRLLRQGIEWHFNPPSASHRGGVWERLIRSVRKVLNAIMNERITTDECLSTLMTEVERIVNNRPLMPVTDDPNDLEVISPSKLLLLRDSTVIMGISAHDNHYRKTWQRANLIAEVFWKRWTHEYVPSLQARQKWCVPERNFTPGDIVLVASDINIRDRWPLGRIVGVTVSRDGMVRRAEIKTETGNVIRDIHKLCLLEGQEPSHSS